MWLLYDERAQGPAEQQKAQGPLPAGRRVEIKELAVGVAWTSWDTREGLCSLSL